MSKNSPAKCYWDNKERLQKRGSERYQSLCKDKKKKKRQYGHQRYKNLSEDEKQKLFEYRKKDYKMRKTSYYDKYSVQKLFF